MINDLKKLKNNEETCPEWLITAMSFAMTGEIRPDMRAITTTLDQSARTVYATCYLDREVTEDDEFDFSVFVTEITSFPFEHTFDHIEMECIYSKEPRGVLYELPDLVYLRRE